MLLVCSLSFFASESLFLGSVLKEGKKFNKVFFSSLVSFLLKSVCNDFAFMKITYFLICALEDEIMTLKVI